MPRASSHARFGIEVASDPTHKADIKRSAVEGYVSVSTSSSSAKLGFPPPKQLCNGASTAEIRSIPRADVKKPFDRPTYKVCLLQS